MGKTLKNSQRTIAAVSVASMALLNVGITSGIAYAQETPQGDSQDGNENQGGTTATAGDGFTEPTAAGTDENGNINIPDKANLKITKRTPDENTAGSQEKANGLPLDEVPGNAAVQGVTFTLYKVEGIDLSKNSGWREANELVATWKDMSEADKRNAGTLGGKTLAKQGEGLETNAQGIATFVDQARGLYVVRESIAKDKKVTIDGKKYPASAIVKATPFIVALPMTNQGDTSKWLETVNVYPKNSPTEIEKTVQDAQTPGTGNAADADPNSNIIYTIQTDVPPNVDKLDTYKIIDPLDSRLTYVSSKLSLVGSTETLTEGDDYTIVQQAGNTDDTVSNDNPQVGTWLTVIFTEDGRKKLVESGATDVKWDLTANVNDISGKNDIENKAFLIPDNEGENVWDGNNIPDEPQNPGEPEVPGTPSEKVVSKYGKVTINKVGDKNAEGEYESKLAGAKFELYECNAQAELGKRVTVDGENEWETKGDDGTVSIDGLHLNDFKNNSTGKTAADADGAGQQTEDWIADSFYCLKETKAPEGYELLPNPIKFQLLQADTDYSKTLEIVNVNKNGGFDLPLTGGKGIFGLIALGALLVLGSIGYIFFASRRQES